MKVNESGMPDEQLWNSLFNITNIVEWLDVKKYDKPVVEVGCGYGTFTLPVLEKLSAKIIAYDIEDAMVKFTEDKLTANHQNNFEIKKKDVLVHGFDEADDSCSAVLLFNILHFKEQKFLLKEAKRVISKTGEIAVIHWRKDIPTPRGPSLEIRPEPQAIIEESLNIGLRQSGPTRILEPWHWGLKLRK